VYFSFDHYIAALRATEGTIFSISPQSKKQDNRVTTVKEGVIRRFNDTPDHIIPAQLVYWNIF